MNGLRQFSAIPKDIREWNRWQREALPQGVITTTQIQDGAVTFDKIENAAPLSVLANATNASASVAALQAGTADRFLCRRGTALTFDALADADIPATIARDTEVTAAITALLAAAIFTGKIRLKGYTVGTLPAGTQGDFAFVTDALAPTYLTALTGGGAIVTPAFHNGASWVAG